MPILQWALICARAITDTETNSMSYIDAIEAISVARLPIPFPPICISTLWRRESAKDSLLVRFRLEDPSGTTIKSFELKSPMSFPTKRHRLNVIIGGTPIQKTGEFLIVIERKSGKTATKWNREKAIPIDISRFELPNAGQKKRPAGGASRRR